MANVLAMDKMIPEIIANFRGDILNSSVLVLDANMSAEALLFAATIAAEGAVPVFMEPVSVVKSLRYVSMYSSRCQ